MDQNILSRKNDSGTNTNNGSRTSSIFLFEVSWEVCNKVGGIYTVLRSKLKQVGLAFANNYILIGPKREVNKHFVEFQLVPDYLTDINSALQKSQIPYKIGYWDTEGRPTVILVEFLNRYKIDNLLYSLWADFGVDSLASNYEYYEPILFATAAAEVIKAITNELLAKKQQVVAHFHEWLCGAGVLYLKKNCSFVATVFTTHATVLGRALASDNRLVYNLSPNFDPNIEAKKYNVFSKHSLERASSKEVDCFTTVSTITADEANMILGKYPDKIVFNGIDIEKKQQITYSSSWKKTKKTLIEIAGKVIGKNLPDNTLLWITSGRYEIHNKGFDVLLKSLAQLETSLPNNSSPIVVFYFLAANWRTKKESLFEVNFEENPEQKYSLGIATHKIHDPFHDGILQMCHEFEFNRMDRKIHIVYSDAYLAGNDGVFDLTYEQIIASCDLSIFPSFYEPWGYTPLESIAYATPTITSDVAGFGVWVNSLKQDYQAAVYVLPRRNVDEITVIKTLTQHLLEVVKSSADEDKNNNIRKKAAFIASLADWQYFYQEYLDAYEQAIRFNKLKSETIGLEGESITSFQEAGVIVPRFRNFQFECPLPEPISELRNLAYNYWWSWHESAKTLFQRIDPKLWEKVRHSPVHFLNLVSNPALQKSIKDSDFIWFYNETIAEFNNYSKTPDKQMTKFCNTEIINMLHPIVYFCMEYGIEECLPIYSGGLGILAGDYLKTMSDLNVPFVAIGLFYKQGYFLQSLDQAGEQVAHYETWNTNQIPMKEVNDSSGKRLIVSVEVQGRTVYTRVWEVKVGHVSLYLLDTNIPDNNAEDREITNSLYGGSKENRLIQEIILGIGGTKLILEKLNLRPSIYHLNEGHSAFSLLERIRFHCSQGLTFEEAVEMVRYSSIFTTHTPVPAGNEEFPESLIRVYFANYVSAVGISMDKLLSLARGVEPNAKVFSMTALCLRLTLSANAVSNLHGKVAQGMWQDIWPGLLENEIPIDVVTNGVHLGMWLGSGMKALYKDYLPLDWLDTQDNKAIWEDIDKIPDVDIWKAHQTQKERLLDIIKKEIFDQYSLRNESKHLINSSLKCLDPNTLLIGISRRFTAYKRNDLFLRDKIRLAKIITNDERPIVILIAGKAHPADIGGKELIKDVIATLRDEIFNGHIIFLEEYNIGLAKLLVRGVDVWLNTPILGREACGTSGMKVAINGGLNFSTKDGWWEEAYNPKVGWQIESLTNIIDIEKRNDLENMFLLNTIETEIAPLYYGKHRAMFNPEWVSKMKASLRMLSPQYNTFRMARDYINNLYCPAVLQVDQLVKNNCTELKAVAAWKKNIIERFNTVKIKAVIIDGIKEGKITCQGLVKIKVLLFSGKLIARELRVEFVLIKSNGHEGFGVPVIIPLRLIDSREAGVLSYAENYQVSDTGFYSYGIRVYPYNGMLFRTKDAGIVYWG